MITREVGADFLCVRQMDHAALSGGLARVWGGPRVPPLMPAESVIFAVGNHDAGWPELDARPTLDREGGGPRTYRNYRLSDALGVAKRSVARVSAADPYAGWLVSRHFASFHDHSDDARAVEWVTEQVGRRAELLSRARPRVQREALHPYVLEANFDWLQLLDALSLALCHDWTTWESRPMALLYGETTGVYRYDRLSSQRRDETTWLVEGRVDPWPFAGDRFEGRIRARFLKRAGWEDDDALLTDWQVAPSATLEVVLRRG